MRNSQHRNSMARCVLMPPGRPLGVLVVIEIVMVVLVAAGYDLPTALACASGAGIAAGHVARRLFDLPHTATEAAR